MSQRAQKTLAIAGAILVVAVFAAANAHLVMVAVQSQPDCVLAAAGEPPAKRVC
ncbi:hypothetical protein [Amaricoccus sp.]|uniref:hypothetical protein n=1 Tax=Amaricoccus sp. TaxID=1872485 RepID=UPI0026388993|nr:hypothetical protein [Amaricoccus sp.]HRO12104.1 hypothetical protein [Amaricoccus sp.]